MSLAAPDHVGRWLGRNREHACALADIAARASWNSRKSLDALLVA